MTGVKRTAHRRLGLAAGVLLAAIGAPSAGALALTWHLASAHGGHAHETEAAEHASSHGHSDGHGHGHAELPAAGSRNFHAAGDHGYHAGDHGHEPVTLESRGLRIEAPPAPAPAAQAMCGAASPPKPLVDRCGTRSRAPCAAPSLSRLCILLL